MLENSIKVCLKENCCIISLKGEKMPHFLIKKSDIAENKVIIKDKDLYKHIIKVFRAKIGEKILFLDEEENQYETILSKIQSDLFEAEIIKKYKSNRKLPLNIYVAQSVLNSNAQISAIQKATELGVKGIIPLHTDNCAVKESVIKNKIEKWRKVVIESVKQCERADIPIVYDLSSINDTVKRFDCVIVFAEKYTDMNFSQYIKTIKIDKSKSILVIIGPEGGFSEKEFEFFKKEKFPLITLGNLIYRADTALVAALTTVINGVLNG